MGSQAVPSQDVAGAAHVQDGNMRGIRSDRNALPTPPQTSQRPSRIGRSIVSHDEDVDEDLNERTPSKGKQKAGSNFAGSGAVRGPTFILLLLSLTVPRACLGLMILIWCSILDHTVILFWPKYLRMSLVHLAPALGINVEVWMQGPCQTFLLLRLSSTLHKALLED